MHTCGFCASSTASVSLVMNSGWSARDHARKHVHAHVHACQMALHASSEIPRALRLAGCGAPAATHLQRVPRVGDDAAVVNNKGVGDARHICALLQRCAHHVRGHTSRVRSLAAANIGRAQLCSGCTLILMAWLPLMWACLMVQARCMLAAGALTGGGAARVHSHCVVHCGTPLGHKLLDLL